MPSLYFSNLSNKTLLAKLNPFDVAVSLVHQPISKTYLYPQYASLSLKVRPYRTSSQASQYLSEFTIVELICVHDLVLLRPRDMALVTWD